MAEDIDPRFLPSVPPRYGPEGTYSLTGRPDPNAIPIGEGKNLANFGSPYNRGLEGTPTDLNAPAKYKIDKGFYDSPEYKNMDTNRAAGQAFTYSPYFGMASSGAISYTDEAYRCLLYTSPSPRDGLLSRMPSSA